MFANNKEFIIEYNPFEDYYGDNYQYNQIYEEFDLEEQYCFSGDSLIPLDYGFDEGEDVLDIKKLRCIMYKLGIAKKQSCPSCGTDDYHYDYNEDCMICNECGHKGEAEYENIENLK